MFKSIGKILKMTISQRYLVYLSYVGSGFRGSQIQENSITVQGVVKNALDTLPCFQKDCSSKTYFTSRTDSGVHAFEAAFQFDMPIIFALHPIHIGKCLNNYFSKKRHLIRATNVLKVPDNFNVRFSVIEKTYLYRIGVLKESFVDEKTKSQLCYPLTELGRTHFVRSFDIDKAREALHLFIGEKNFKSFEGVPSKSDCHPICKINSFIIKESQPLCSDIDFHSPKYDYYSFICNGSRFLRYMVRRMVGTVLAVGRNSITLNDVKQLFEKPGNSILFSKIPVPPGSGLYLLKTVFNPDHLVISKEDQMNKLAQFYKQYAESKAKGNQSNDDLIKNSESVCQT